MCGVACHTGAYSAVHPLLVGKLIAVQVIRLNRCHDVR